MAHSQRLCYANVYCLIEKKLFILTNIDLRNESFLIFDLSKVNLIKGSLNKDERKLKYHYFFHFYYHTFWHINSNQNLESNKDSYFWQNNCVGKYQMFLQFRIVLNLIVYSVVLKQ